VIVELPAVGAIDAVVEVIPPASVAHRPPHHGRQRDARGPADEAPGFGDHAHALRQPGERRADRPAEPLDGRGGFQVVDRESAADVERVERAEPAGGSRVDETRAGPDRLHVHVGPRDLRTHVEREAGDADARPRRQRDEIERRRRVAAELPGQVDDRRAAAERHAQQQPHAFAIRHELGDLVRVVDDESRDAVLERMADVGVALDRVRVDAARRGYAGIADEVHLAVGREIEP
jgi:hypothetical protein